MTIDEFRNILKILDKEHHILNFVDNDIKFTYDVVILSSKASSICIKYKLGEPSFITNTLYVGSGDYYCEFNCDVYNLTYTSKNVKNISNVELTLYYNKLVKYYEDCIKLVENTEKFIEQHKIDELIQEIKKI